ncbi:SEC-C domain-containing protein [Actinoplanes sp. NPDC051861]|uniref:SEC-C domain-containing protein n=1 Tax=Actinoplanes sp. NPDC051861 TaxID=3155170 RepID=UPI003441B4DF
MLTGDDLDAIGHEALHAADPLPFITRLVDAVDRDRLADPADAGYALTLAAESTERQGDLPGALALVDRAVAVHQPGGDGYARSYRGLLLARMGRDDDASAEFAVLRPRLVREAFAATYLSEAMEECGRATIAEQWLTSALDSLLDREEEPDEDGVAVVSELLRARLRIRGELGLPPDERDEAALLVQYGYGDSAPAGPAPLFWARPEFDRMLMRWPSLGDVYGRTWDEHRAQLERTLGALAPGSAMAPGTADGLAAYAARSGGEPTDPVVRAGYESQTAFGMPWPPGRNEPCWCGSGAKYKKCCLPRGRG